MAELTQIKSIIVACPACETDYLTTMNEYDIKVYIHYSGCDCCDDKVEVKWETRCRNCDSLQEITLRND